MSAWRAGLPLLFCGLFLTHSTAHAQFQFAQPRQPDQIYQASATGPVVDGSVVPAQGIQGVPGQWGGPPAGMTGGPGTMQPDNNGTVAIPWDQRPRGQAEVTPSGALRYTRTWDAYMQMQFIGGNDIARFGGDLFVPLWQNADTLIFADIRGNSDDSENYETNIGLALRKMVNDWWILGGYAFYDRKWTDNNNEFDQLTLGLELLSVNWEARGNVYIAEDGQKRAGNAFATGDGRPQAVFDGNTINVVSGGTSNFTPFETAYSGFDAEMGWLLYGHEPDNDFELRGFLGGFYFDTDERGYEEIAGPRGRLEMRMYDLAWLGDGSRVTLGVESTWDDVRDVQVGGLVRVRIPLGWADKMGKLERRMTDRIVRDVDIVTNRRDEIIANDRVVEPGLFADNNQLIGRVTVIDADTNNPEQTSNAAGPNSTVIADGSLGAINTTGQIVLQPGQTFRGAGFLVRGSVTGQVARFGTRPLISSSNPFQPVILIALNNTIQDFDVAGGLNGFQTTNFGTANLDAGTTIDNTTATQTQLAGYRFGDVLGTVTNNRAFNTGSHGFQFDDIGGTVSNNAAEDTGAIGFFGTGSILAGGNMQNNTALRTGTAGFFLGDVNGNFTGNTSTASGGQGFRFLQIGGNVNNNIADDSGATTGFSFTQLNLGGNFNNNQAINGGVGTLTNNVDGFLFGVSQGTMNNNIATDNRGDGYEFDDILLGGVFSNNQALRNGVAAADAGFDFDDIFGVVTGNRAENNFGDGFEFDEVRGVGSNPVVPNSTFSNNVSNNNGVEGYDGGAINSPNVNNNVGFGNAAGGNTFP